MQARTHTYEPLRKFKNQTPVVIVGVATPMTVLCKHNNEEISQYV